MNLLERSTDVAVDGVRCGVRGCACGDQRTVLTVANVVTVTRTVASLVLVTAATAQHSWPLLVAAYLTYWVGDVADGAVARALGQETRLGAVLDVACDRLNCTSCALVLLQLVPAPWPVAVFLVQFVLVDLVLTLLPLRWPLLSPNYFGLVDPLVHRINWHPVAKAANTALLVVLLVLVPATPLPLVVALGVLVVKLGSLVRVLGLARPTGDGHVRDRVQA